MPLRRGRWNVVDYPDKEKTSKDLHVQAPPQASVVPPSATFANMDTPEATPPSAGEGQQANPPSTTSMSASTPSLATEQTDNASRNYFNEGPGAEAAPRGTLNPVRTVPSNLHALGAMTSNSSDTLPAAVSAGGGPGPGQAQAVVVTTHHTYHGNQVWIFKDENLNRGAIFVKLRNGASWGFFLSRSFSCTVEFSFEYSFLSGTFRV